MNVALACAAFNIVACVIMAQSVTSVAIHLGAAFVCFAISLWHPKSGQAKAVFTAPFALLMKFFHAHERWAIDYYVDPIGQRRWACYCRCRHRIEMIENGVVQLMLMANHPLVWMHNGGEPPKLTRWWDNRNKRLAAVVLAIVVYAIFIEVTGHGLHEH